MRLFAVITILVLSTGLASGQIVNDPDANTHVPHPAYSQDRGPIVAVDSGHNNYHTIENRYEPFAALLRNDGFRMVDVRTPFSAASLAPFQVLVISNALPAALVNDWTLPASSAFSAAEIGAIKSWVLGGGSLLLIADHQPFAGSARNLALEFGFQFQDGVVARDPMDGRPDIFTLADGTLRKDAITLGRNDNEAVTSVRSFTGSGFRAPPTARPLMVFAPGFMIHQCGLPCPAKVPEYDAAGFSEGAVSTFGKGRVAVFGEAAMFTAQEMRFPAKSPYRFGFDAPGAEQNKQFILNLMHWLAAKPTPP